MKTHISCSITIFFFENRAVYEIMWKNIVQSDRPQMTIWQKRISCWIRKATNTNQACVLLLVHCKNGCTNAPQYYVIRTWLVLLLS